MPQDHKQAPLQRQRRAASPQLCRWTDRQGRFNKGSDGSRKLSHTWRPQCAQVPTARVPHFRQHCLPGKPRALWRAVGPRSPCRARDGQRAGNTTSSCMSASSPECLSQLPTYSRLHTVPGSGVLGPCLHRLLCPPQPKSSSLHSAPVGRNQEPGYRLPSGRWACSGVQHPGGTPGQGTAVGEADWTAPFPAQRTRATPTVGSPGN